MYNLFINKLWKGMRNIINIIATSFILWMIIMVFVLAFFKACKKNNDIYDEHMNDYIHKNEK